MESVNVTNAILDKKIEHYSFEKRDFIAEGEITVTITLSEYRELVKEVATKRHDIDKANSDRYERESENKRLKEEVETLREKLYVLQNQPAPGDLPF